VVDIAQLEFFIRDDLNKHAPRAMAVLNPLKVIISNYPEEKVEILSVANHPELDLGHRDVPFTREIFIDQDDFKEEYSKKFKKKLSPGKRIRLRSGYVIEADDYEKDADGNVTLIKASLIENTLGADPEDDIKPKGVVHWVSASHGIKATIRRYDRLFTDEAPDRGDKNFLDFINPESLSIVDHAWVEPSLASSEPETVFQFEREGYFVADRYDHTGAEPVFNMTIGLRSQI